MLYLISFLFPNIAYADFNSFMGKVYKELFNPAMKFFIVLAFALFVYGLAVFLSNMDNDEKKTSGKSHMIWGIIGITIMLSVWGIIGVILKTFNIKGIDFNEGGAYDDSKPPDPIIPDPDSGDDNNYGMGNTNMNINTNSNSSDLSNNSNSDSMNYNLEDPQSELDLIEDMNFEDIPI